MASQKHLLFPTSESLHYYIINMTTYLDKIFFAVNHENFQQIYSEKLLILVSSCKFLCKHKFT